MAKEVYTEFRMVVPDVAAVMIAGILASWVILSAALDVFYSTRSNMAVKTFWKMIGLFLNNFCIFLSRKFRTSPRTEEYT